MKANRFLLGLSITLGLFTAASPATALTAIINARLVTMDANYRVLPKATILMEGERIAAIGDEALLKTTTPETLIDAQGGIVMPGMISLHNHISMIAFR
ncbi:MAG: amidohydrolase, partial [Pseudomonadota bacterium]